MVALWLLTPVSVFGQAAAAARKAANTIANGTWIPPRTLDGQPDLQGVWLNRSATPLERPRALEGRAFLTDEEVNELRKRADRLFGGNAVNDFAGGDNVFLAALTNPERYIPPNGRSTGGADEMIEREFENRTSLISDPPDGRIPPMTAEGRERSARTPPLAAGPGQRPPAGPEDFSNAMRCITYGVPRLGLNNVNSAGPLGYYQILQAPGYVVLMLEAIHEARIIPLGDRPHLPRSIRQWTGDSRGRWEGNTLVVDTTNFSPRSNFMGSAENLHLIERLTRVAPDTINYEITISDPTTWTKPWTAVIRLKQRHERIYEYACHEGNYMVVREVRLVHAREFARCEYERMFRAPVVFAADRNELVFDSAILDQPVHRRDPELGRLLSRYASQELSRIPVLTDLPSQLTQVLRRQLEDGGNVDVASIADLLQMPVRTMQRRLSDHATSFTVLLDQARRSLAPALLADPESNVEQVGFRLGYSEPTAFIRAFKKWYGVTPGSYRRARCR